MALQRCILGVVVLLSVSVWSVAADQGLGDAETQPESEKLQGVDPKPDLDLNSDQDQELDDIEDQNNRDIDLGNEDSAKEDENPEDDDSDEDNASDDEDSEEEDNVSEEENDVSEDDDNISGQEDDVSGQEDDVSGQEDDVSDQEDNLSVAERLELVNQNLDGDQDSVIEDGDIAVPRHRHVQKRNADPCTRKPWWMFWRRRCTWRRRRNGKVYVPYVIANHYSPSQVKAIKQAFRSFAQRTCIRFVRNYRRRILWWRRWRYRDYLYIHSSSGCWSYIGRRRGRQRLSLQKNGCVHLGVIQHELLHALGFRHEQNRSDRDRYIRVLWGNIKRGKKHNFSKVATLNLGTPYDYGSVMHYRKTAFSKNGKPTLVARRSNVTFGTAKSMSVWDIRRVNRLYCR